MAVTERINQILEELLNEFTKAEGLATDANKSMPEGIGARISHERYAIIDATKNSKESLERLLKILEELEKQIKKIISTPIGNLNDTEREIIVTLSDVNRIIKEAKNGAKSTLEFSKKATIYVNDDDEYARCISGFDYGEKLQRNIGEDLRKAGIDKVIAEKNALGNKARSLTSNSFKAREFRKNVFQEIKLLNKIISPLNKKKERLDRLINPPSEEAMISEAKKQFELKNFDAALKYYEIALELNPNNETTKQNILKIIGIKEEDMISKASKQYNLGNFDAALKYYEIALELNPNNEITRYNRDIAIEKIKNK